MGTSEDRDVWDRASMRERRKIDAFLSYARSSSVQQAVSLKEGLETFDRRWDRRRRTRVFLDDQSMSANASLQGAIEDALTRAGWLIVLLSEAAAISSWVNQEIAWWLAHKTPETMLLVQVDGVVTWDGGRQDFTGGSTAVPPALRGALRSEPRWIDLKWFAFRDDPIKDPAFESTVLQLYCPLKGLDRADAVAQRDKNVRMARRLARGAVTGLVVLTLGAIGAGIAALLQAQRANEQAEIARAQTVVAASKTLAAQAVANVDTNFGLAQLQAIQGLELDDNNQTRAAVYEVAQAVPNLTYWAEAPDEVTALHFPPGGGVLVGLRNGEVLRWILEEQRFESIMKLGGPVSFVASDDRGEMIVANGEGGPRAWNKGEVMILPSTIDAVAVSHDGKWVMAGTKLVDVTGRVVDEMMASFGGPHEASFTADDSQVVALMWDTMDHYEVTSDGLELLSSQSLWDLNRNYEGAYFARDGSAFAAFRGIFPYSRVRMTSDDNGFGARATTDGVLPLFVAIGDGGRKVAAFGSDRIVVSEPFPCIEYNVCVTDQTSTSTTLVGLGDATVAAFQGDSRLVGASGKSLAVWDLRSAGRGVVQGRSGIAEGMLGGNLAVLADGSAAALIDWSDQVDLVIIKRDPYEVIRVPVTVEANEVVASESGDSFVLVDRQYGSLEEIDYALQAFDLDGNAIEPVPTLEKKDGIVAENGTWIDDGITTEDGTWDLDGVSGAATELLVRDEDGNVVLAAPIPLPMNLSRGMVFTVYGLSRDGSQLYIVTGENPDAPEMEVQIWPVTGEVGEEQEATAGLSHLVEVGCSLVGRSLTSAEWDPSAVGIPEPAKRACAK